MYTFVDPLRRGALVAPDRPALVCDDRTTTFGEVLDHCRRIAGLCDQLGLDGEDRVALLAANSDTYIELYTAIPAAGRAIMPLNTRWAEPELHYAIDDSGARVLITDGDPGPLAASVERVIRTDTGELDELLAAAPAADLGVGVTPDSIAGLFYTGGTTGLSKGVVLTHQNLTANAIHITISVGMRGDDVYLAIAPMFHAAGSAQILACLWLGSTQVVQTAFDPDAALDLIETHHTTVSLGVPTMVAAMNAAYRGRPRDTSSMRLFTYGGSPIATEVVRDATTTFPNAELVHLYGATETAPLITTLPQHDRHIDGALARSAGPPVLGVEVEIRGDGEAALPPGEVGRVCTRGHNVMRGYWNKPEQTEAVLVDGWYDTGDLGHLDERGNLFLVDRAKDMIVSGGENVYSTEVEEILFRHPGIREATVFGIPDEQWGEAVHAVVVPVEGAELTEDEIIEFCREWIAGYKVPKSVELRSEPLPISGPGKVLKRELRAPFWEGHDSQVN